MESKWKNMRICREEALKLADFIQNSPTPFSCSGTDGGDIEAGGISPAGGIPKDGKSTGVAAHSDSPTFKVKEQARMTVKGHYTKLNTEGYGGMLCCPFYPPGNWNRMKSES